MRLTLLPLWLALAAGCTVQTLSPVGRPCQEDRECGPGTFCQSATHLCLPRAADGASDRAQAEVRLDVPAADVPGDRGPAERLADLKRLDAKPDAPRADLKPDQKKLDLKPGPDLIGCSPGAFLSCKTASIMRRCNSSGTGTVEIPCPYQCNGTTKQCNECAPSTTTCMGAELWACSSDGKRTLTTCTLGCQSGACCKDADGDGITDCSGDCNDGNKHVFPGQTQYFFVSYQTPSGGNSFDYDCDGQAEPQSSQLSIGLCTSQTNQTACDAATGWAANAVPSCGSGSWRGCVWDGAHCTDGMGPYPVQGCH